MTPDYTKFPEVVTGDYLFEVFRKSPLDGWGRIAAMIEAERAEWRAKLANCVEIPDEKGWPEDAEGWATCFYRGVKAVIGNNLDKIPFDFQNIVVRKRPTPYQLRAELQSLTDTMDADKLARVIEEAKRVNG